MCVYTQTKQKPTHIVCRLSSFLRVKNHTLSELLPSSSISVKSEVFKSFSSLIISRVLSIFSFWWLPIMCFCYWAFRTFIVFLLKNYIKKIHLCYIDQVLFLYLYWNYQKMFPVLLLFQYSFIISVNVKNSLLINVLYSLMKNRKNNLMKKI